MLPFYSRHPGLSQVTAAEGISSEADVAKGGGAPNRETEDMPEAREVVQDEKTDVEAEAEEKEALSSDAQAVDREAVPSTFDDLCHEMAERAKFLLEVIFDEPNFEAIRSSLQSCYARHAPLLNVRVARYTCGIFPPFTSPTTARGLRVLYFFVLCCRQLSPSTVQSPSAAAEGTSALMQHLAEEISDLATPSPRKLQSRLLRWRSEDRGNERWKGVVDVLRVRSQVTDGARRVGSSVGLRFRVKLFVHAHRKQHPDKLSDTTLSSG